MFFVKIMYIFLLLYSKTEKCYYKVFQDIPIKISISQMDIKVLAALFRWNWIVIHVIFLSNWYTSAIWYNNRIRIDDLVEGILGFVCEIDWK